MGLVHEWLQAVLGVRCCCQVDECSSEIHEVNTDVEAPSEHLIRGDFTVQLHRKSVDVPLFLVEVVEHQLVVAKPLEGIEKDWNSSQTEDLNFVVRQCDRIVSVNSESTNMSKMLFDCNMSQDLNLVVRHPGQSDEDARPVSPVGKREGRHENHQIGARYCRRLESRASRRRFTSRRSHRFREQDQERRNQHAPTNGTSARAQSYRDARAMSQH